jgi:hypothetical protein
MPEITIDETKIGHMFRNSRGHFREDSAGNRRILIEVANRPANYRGTDRFDSEWFAETQADGTQVWVQVRSGKIVNGGLNVTPWEFAYEKKTTIS